MNDLNEQKQNPNNVLEVDLISSEIERAEASGRYVVAYMEKRLSEHEKKIEEQQQKSFRMSIISSIISGVASSCIFSIIVAVWVYLTSQ